MLREAGEKLSAFHQAGRKTAGRRKVIVAVDKKRDRSVKKSAMPRGSRPHKGG